MQSSMPRGGRKYRQLHHFTLLFGRALRVRAIHDDMIRDRIDVGIVDSSLSFKLQLHSKLTLKKANDAARQCEAAKREQAGRCETSCQMRQMSILSKLKGSRSPIQRNRRWRQNLNRTTANATFAEGHRQIKRRCVQPEKQRASTVTNSVILVSCVDQRSPLMRSPKHPDPEVAFLGEVTKNDEPWTSTDAMEAMGTQCRADICFKLDTGEIKVKVWFYIALYPVRWTAQSALHFPPVEDLFIPTPFSASLGSILSMQQLRKDYSLTFPPLSIARYQCIQLSRPRRREVKENAQTSKR